MGKCSQCSSLNQKNPHKSEDQPAGVAVVEVSVYLLGQLLFVDVLLKDPCSSHCVDLGSSGMNKKLNGRKPQRLEINPKSFSSLL